MKFTSKIVMVVLAITLLSSVSFAQKRTFYLGQLDSVCTNTVSVPLYTKGFVNVLDFQFSINWDTTVLTYTSVKVATNNLLGITSGNYNALRKGFGLIWFDQTVMGTTVPDSTLILTLTFTYKAGAPTAGLVPVYFGNVPAAIGSVDTTDGAGNNVGQVLDTALISGYANTPAGTPTITFNGPVLTATTSGCGVPTSYQWYTVVCTGPGGPGSPQSCTYTAIPGATSATYNYSYAANKYAVVATYTGHKDTSSTVLPIRLINFKGRNNNNANLLSWTTASETNSSVFAIERSSNGESFTQIGSVKAAGNSNVEKTYNYTDAGFNSFSNYYRLKMVDENGTFMYSNIVKLNKEGKSVFQVQPNPVENSTVNVYGSNMKFAKVYDVNGRLLFSQSITTPEHAQLKMNNLAKGVYMINVTTTDGQTQTDKFIVK